MIELINLVTIIYMKNFLIVLFAFFTFQLSSNTDINNQEHIVIEIINKTMKRLKSRLEVALKDGSTVAALKMCRTEAQKLTILNNNKKTTLKRISLKYRNPANKPTKQEELILMIF